LTLDFKTGTFLMPLIEEKIGIDFAGIYSDKRCARCVNIAPVARNVSRHDATPLYNRAGRISRII
jgi:hypothetical protein